MGAKAEAAATRATAISVRSISACEFRHHLFVDLVECDMFYPTGGLPYEIKSYFFNFFSERTQIGVRGEFHDV